MLDFSKKPLILAPMAGVSDVGMRKLCSRFGADATVGEMLSSRAMLFNPKKTALMTETDEEEKYKLGQIFGHESDIMAMSIINPMLDGYDSIDINMGCPAPKIVKNGEGCALMKNLPLASEIIRACVKASKKPVSVKFRLGVDSDISTQFGRMCEESGAKFITLHARTAAMGYSGRADYEAIARLKAAVKIPVIGNGDVVDLESYQRMKETGVDGVMIGRGSLGKPWIFSILKGEKPPKDIYKVIEEHVYVLRSRYREEWLVQYMRKHFLWYISSFKNASDYRRLIATSPDLDGSLKMLRQILK